MPNKKMRQRKHYPPTAAITADATLLAAALRATDTMARLPKNNVDLTTIIRRECLVRGFTPGKTEPLRQLAISLVEH